jgi:hypothetical protein
VAIIDEVQNFGKSARLSFAFGVADYYNTDNKEKINRAIIKAALGLFKKFTNCLGIFDAYAGMKILNCGEVLIIRIGRMIQK